MYALISCFLLPVLIQGFDSSYYYDPQVEMDPMKRYEALRAYEEFPESHLYGAKYISGGAGEGNQYLGPENEFYNKVHVKTDAVLPAYCEPPNPCPPGYTSKDGCLEEFENTEIFSREYQAQQDCMCDKEHMNAGTCPPDEEDPQQAAYGNQNTVAKKFSPQRNENPYLAGEKTKVVAKKG